MPRLFAKIFVPIAALATFAVGSTIAWSNNVSLKGDLVTRNPMTQIPVTKSAPAVPDFDAAFASRTKKADRETISRPVVTVTPATVTPVPVDFNQAFADATSTSRRDNKPTKREKLRNAGWSRIAGTR